MELITKIKFRANHDNISVVCYVDAVFFNSIVVKNMKIVKGRDGNLFVGMPSFINSSNEWEDIVYPVSQEVKKELELFILDEYFKQKKKQKEEVKMKLPF